MSMGPMYFYTGVPDSKTATLPSSPRKGKVSTGDIQKTGAPVNKFLWGGYTVEITNNKDKK